MATFHEVPRPERPRGTEQESIQQVYRYLFKLSERLENVINTISAGGVEAATALGTTPEDNAEMLLMLKSDKRRIDGLVTELGGANSRLDSTIARLDTVSNSLDNAYIEVDKLDAKIKLMATEASIAELVNRVTQAEILIDGANAAIQLKASSDEVSAMGQRLSQAEIDINGLDARIKLLATESSIADLASRVSKAEIDIDGAKAAIGLKADVETVDGLTKKLSEAEVRIDGANAAISLKASQSDVDGLTDRVSQAEIAIDGANASIRLKASKDELNEVSLSLDAANKRISAKADLVRVEAIETEITGLVKLEQLYAVQGQISNLTSGLTTASVLRASIVSATDVTGTYGNFSAINHNGALVSQRNITMGGITSAGKALSTGGTLDLSHSHAVSVNGDGTITLGEVATTGGSFKIADTAYYKNGVSAAKASVKLSGLGWQGGQYRVEATNGEIHDVDLPSFSVSGGDTFASNKTTVYFSTPSVNGYLKNKEVDATPVYNNGWNACRDACTLARSVYTISENSPGTLYMKVGESYTSVGSSWVKVKAATAYNRPAAKT